MKEFVDRLNRIQSTIDFKVSKRGWCYLLEELAGITKGEFDVVDGAIDKCIKRGLLPVDFVLADESRRLIGVDWPTPESPVEVIQSHLDSALELEKWYNPDWWEGEEYYIQMAVEKGDLVSLFAPVCFRYHIPIMSGRGWSSKQQRFRLARNFLIAEQKGLKPVLLYCGDYDPGGLQISDTLRKNLEQAEKFVWSDGSKGWDPKNLVIDRFGLNLDYIIKQGLSWIPNLQTARKDKGVPRDLGDPNHPQHNQPHVQDYRKTLESVFGKGNWKRKYEANSLVIRQKQSRALCKKAIEKYLGRGAASRFEKRKSSVHLEFDRLRKRMRIDEVIERAKRYQDSQ